MLEEAEESLKDQTSLSMQRVWVWYIEIKLECKIFAAFC